MRNHNNSLLVAFTLMLGVALFMYNMNILEAMSRRQQQAQQEQLQQQHHLRYTSAPPCGGDPSNKTSPNQKSKGSSIGDEADKDGGEDDGDDDSVSSKQQQQTSTTTTTDENIHRLYQVATNHAPRISDKVTAHRYHIMYGTFLLPFYQSKPHMRMLEIGLGCDMAYGPGASATLWKELFPQAELWEAELNAKCVRKAQQSGQALDGFHVLVGDQGDPKVLDSWVEKSNGGHFDVVIDDGGHHNKQIKDTFDKFWPLLNPGGLYFMEDLHVGRKGPHTKDDPSLIMSKVLHDWMEQLIYSGPKFAQHQKNVKHPLPDDVAIVMCQNQACMVQKLPENKEGMDIP